MTRPSYAVVLATVVAVSVACSANDSAKDKAVEDARTAAEELKDELADAAETGHAGVESFIDLRKSANDTRMPGDYIIVNGATGVIDAAIVRRKQTGGGLFAEDETVVLCVTYVIDIETVEVDSNDTTCPDEIFAPGYDAGPYSTGGATEIDL